LDRPFRKNQQTFYAWLIHHPDDGGSLHHLDVGLLRDYTNEIARSYIPEGCHCYTCHREKLKSHILVVVVIRCSVRGLIYQCITNLNNATKIGFEPHELSTYGKLKGAVFLATKETEILEKTRMFHPSKKNFVHADMIGSSSDERAGSGATELVCVLYSK
jgi:hypothetical protein